MPNSDISVAFDAMIAFLTAYWERGERASDDIAVLLGSLARHDDGMPMDPALWEDWMTIFAAVGRDSDGAALSSEELR